jgi:hypothetical protein
MQAVRYTALLTCFSSSSESCGGWAGCAGWVGGAVYTDTGAYDGRIPYMGVGIITTGPTEGYRAYEGWEDVNWKHR